MRWDELIGQSRATAVLQNAIRRGRIAHAYLFSGPEGVGKSTAALLFAQSLNCLDESTAAMGGSCGRCRSCESIRKGSHPDVRLLTTKDGDEASVIPIEVIREDLVHDIHLKPVSGRYKVYIVDPADRTAPLAIHTVLRVLEEPPPRVVIVLVTARPALLPPTVLSRCQHVTFQLAGTGAVEDLLVRSGVARETAAALSKLSGGRVGWAVQAASRPEVITTRRALLDLCADLGRQPLSATLRIAEEIRLLARELAEASGREEADGTDADEEEGESATPAARRSVGDRALRSELPWCLDVMASWYRDCLAACAGAPLVNPDYEQAIMGAGRSLSCGRAESAVEAVLEAKQQIGRNGNIDLTLECLSVQLLSGST
jgi:DNA polymerase-3 subunit delta'